MGDWNCRSVTAGRAGRILAPCMSSLVEPELARSALGRSSSEVVSGCRLTPQLALSRLRAARGACHCPGLCLLPGRVYRLAAL
ncbi:MAG: hypothetical protein F4X34_05085 [Chloroflexi bacterium]|nr:hypothetical protein [Chloroflexota bacterium]